MRVLVTAGRLGVRMPRIFGGSGHESGSSTSVRGTSRRVGKLPLVVADLADRPQSRTCSSRTASKP